MMISCLCYCQSRHQSNHPPASASAPVLTTTPTPYITHLTALPSTALHCTAPHLNVQYESRSVNDYRRVRARWKCSECCRSKLPGSEEYYFQRILRYVLHCTVMLFVHFLASYLLNDLLIWGWWNVFTACRCIDDMLWRQCMYAASLVCTFQREYLYISPIVIDKLAPSR